MSDMNTMIALMAIKQGQDAAAAEKKKVEDQLSASRQESAYLKGLLAAGGGQRHHHHFYGDDFMEDDCLGGGFPGLGMPGCLAPGLGLGATSLFGGVGNQVAFQFQSIMGGFL